MINVVGREVIFMLSMFCYVILILFKGSVLPTILSARLERSRQTPIDTEVASINSETDKVAPITKITIVSPEKTSELYGDDDDNEDESIETFSPKPVQEAPVTSPVRASLTPMSSQRV